MSDIEFSLVQVSVMHGLKQGNDVLKEIHKEMNPESVEKLLEETAEARAYQRVRRAVSWKMVFCLANLSDYHRKSTTCSQIR